MQKLLQQFVAEYKGRPLEISLCGGGTSLTRLCLIPGADELINYLTFTPLNKQELPKYWAEQMAGLDEDYCGVAVAARTTQVNWSPLPNEAYIVIDDRKWQLNMPHLTEKEFLTKNPESLAVFREWEDYIISTIVMKLLYPLLDWEIPSTVSLEKLT